MCNENTFVIITDRDLFSSQSPSSLPLRPSLCSYNQPNPSRPSGAAPPPPPPVVKSFFLPVAAAAAAIDSRVESFVVLGACEVKDETRRRRRLNANEEEEEERRRK